MTKSFSLNLIIAFAILIVGFLVSFTIVAHAQTATTSTDTQVTTAGITFPIAELGNCGSKDACRDYCNIPGNMPACISFAKVHGLMNNDEAKRAEQFKEKLDRGAGPGGCKSPGECAAFCENVANIETCTKFAQEHGLSNTDTEGGDKIAAYLKAGGQMPGGCNSKESCEKYCSDFTHAQECSRFAQKAGLTQVRGGVPGKAEGRFEGGIPPGQFQKFLEAIKNGQTPGGCKSKEECEKYCSDSSHRDECIAFAEKVGFVEHDQAEKIRQSGGRGPGNCDSPDACRSYCADQTHHDECFKFAQDHGFITADEADKLKDSFVRLRQGLENASPEVTECLKSNLGPNIINDIQAGKLTPGPEIGDRVRGCFEKFGQKGDPTEPFKKAPAEVLGCVKEKLGADVYAKVSSGQAQPTAEMGDAFRVCFQQFQLQNNQGQFGRSQFGTGQFGVPPIQNFLKSAPPGVAECLKDKLGDDFDKLQSGQAQPSPDIYGKVKSCFQEFKPEAVQFNPERRGFERKIEGGPGNLPAEVLECVKATLGADVAEKIKSGEVPTGDIKDKIQSCIDKFRGNSNKYQPSPLGRPSVTPSLSPQVADCVRSSIGTEAFDKFTSGGSPTSDLKNVVQACLEKLKSTAPQPTPPFSEEKPSGTVCVQVITPAKDPVTGVCKQFLTPCDVPAGWIKGCEASSTEVYR